MKKEITYKLIGLVVATNWYGVKGFSHLLIETDPDGLEKIKKDPLQDYINYGVQSVDYVDFLVYRTERYTRNGFKIIKETEEPIEEIEAGTLDLTETEQEFVLDLLTQPPDIVHYK